MMIGKKNGERNPCAASYGQYTSSKDPDWTCKRVFERTGQNGINIGERAGASFPAQIIQTDPLTGLGFDLTNPKPFCILGRFGE
jgi:hypothetical protein